MMFLKGEKGAKAAAEIFKVNVVPGHLRKMSNVFQLSDFLGLSCTAVKNF